MTTTHSGMRTAPQTRTARLPNRWLAVAGAAALVALATGPQAPLGGFWGAPSAADLGLGGALTAGFLVYGLIEAIGFGLGVVWLAFGRHLLAPGTLGTTAYLSIGWLLASWYPHGSLHQGLGHDNHAGLLAIEYGFHATMIVAAAVVLTYLHRSAPDRGSSEGAVRS